MSVAGVKSAGYSDLISSYKEEEVEPKDNNNNNNVSSPLLSLGQCPDLKRLVLR